MGQQCRRCQKMNHFAKVCQAKPVNNVQLWRKDDTRFEDSEEYASLYMQLSQQFHLRTDNFTNCLR